MYQIHGWKWTPTNALFTLICVTFATELSALLL